MAGTGPPTSAGGAGSGAGSSTGPGTIIGRTRKLSAAAQPPSNTPTPTTPASAPSSASALPPSLVPGATPSMSSTPVPHAAGTSTVVTAPGHPTGTGPTSLAECEAVAKTLTDKESPLRRKMETIGELRDTAEGQKDFAFYEKYLGVLMPAITGLLGEEDKIVFFKDAMDQRFRHAMLVWLTRIPRNDIFKAYQASVLDLALKLLQVENEDNGLMCIKLLIDGIRTNKEVAEPYIERFIETIKQLYGNIKSLVEKEFGNEKPEKPTNPDAPSPSVPLARAIHSPKCLTECPIAIVLIFQTYRSSMQTALQEFFPHAIENIQVMPEPQKIAFEESAAKGDIFVGIAPKITNRELFAEFYKAQTKTIAFLAYVLRNFPTLFLNEYLAVLPEACIRLLRSCTPDDVSTRKELLIATRHVLMSEQRAVFAPYVEMLLNERVLMGTSVTAHESLRALAYSIVADLIHHIRNDLSIQQLAAVVHSFSVCLNDSTFPTSIQTMSGKLLNTAIETIVAKGDQAEVTRLLSVIMTTSIERLVALTLAFERLRAAQAKDEGKSDLTEEEDLKKNGWRDIERGMPVYAISYAHESVEGFCRDARFLSKTLLHTVRTVCQQARQLDYPGIKPDGYQIGLTFEHSIRCFAMFEYSRDPREQKEAFELLSQILFIAEPHVFNEVWTKHMSHFIRQPATAPQFFPVLQTVITHESVSSQVVAILLRYLMDHLADYGDMNPQETAMTLKLFKMTFTAINHFIFANEAIMVPHLQKLILGCLEQSARATEPAIYYQILRSLFRSIGGGRFELLYKEVLPILQEVLDILAYLLAHSRDDAHRDLFVELTLTVPVRLTNLLPYLSYLMRPLAHALRGAPDSVSQGLRTLELCVDNLSAEFLDPTMHTVTGSLIDALNGLLRPVPSHRQHAHAALKILGKLGGRNRRFVEVDYDLEWSANPALFVTMAFEGKKHDMELAPLIEAAAKLLDTPEGPHKESFEVLKMATLNVMQQDGPPAENNPIFTRAMTALISASQKDDIKEDATKLVRDICRRVFAAEVQRKDTRTTVDKVELDIAKKRYLNMTSALTDCFVETLATCRPADRDGICELLATVMQDFRSLPPAIFPPPADSKTTETKIVERGLNSFVHRICALCQEEDWSRKLSGATAIRSVVDRFETNKKLVSDLELEFVRALLFCLKDVPKLVPRTATDIVDLLKRIIRTVHSQPLDELRDRLVPRLVETLVMELNSQSEFSRSTVKECLQTLSEVLEKPIADLIMPAAKSKFLDANTGPLYSKPLRALPFSMQVANIEAMTFILSLKTVMTDMDDPFVRTMHEVLALADVDDAKLMNGLTTHRQEEWIKQLRVACLRFLQHTMTNFDFTQPPQRTVVRSRVVHVYFKHIYSGSPPVKECAHEALNGILERESILSRVPKDVIQAGLRPILVNLADTSRLTVSGLDGLSRFLELMMSYFKVEIGLKLLEHFRVIGDTATLQKAAYGLYEDNQDLARLSRLINIFRLLPPSAPQYLEPVVQHVVDAETILRQTVPGPFSDNLARYLDKYHAEGCTNLFNNIRNPRFVWTYRSVIRTGKAPKLVDEIASRSNELFTQCFQNHENTELVVAGLLIAREVAMAKKGWLSSSESVLSSLVGVWRSILAKSRSNSPDVMLNDYITIPNLMLDCYMISLEEKQHVALLFHLVEAFEIKSPIEKSRVAFFLYEHAALQSSVPYRRELLEHFFGLYETEGVSWAFKSAGIRLVVNPILRIYFAKPSDLTIFDLPNDKPIYDQSGKPMMDENGKIMYETTTPLVERISRAVWRPLATTTIAKMRDDGMLVELFVMTHQMVLHAQDKVAEARKEIFKFLWMGINLVEPTVKLTAYVCATRFMATFATPAKFIKLIWTGIMRLKDVENRALYREAIDVLAEVVSGRKVPKEIGTEKTTPGPLVPDWAGRVRSILNEDGHGTGQLVMLCELLVNNADLFYPYREMFVPIITMSLQRLAFFQGATPELKKLSVDIVETIFRWERRRMAAKEEADKVDDEASPAKRQRTSRAGPGTATATVSSSSSGGWATPTGIKESITSHLLRLVATSPEPTSKGGLTKRSLDLFKEIIGPKGLVVQIKLGFFNRTMKGEITDANVNVAANSAETLAAIAAVRDQSWIRSNLGTLSGLLERLWSFDDLSLHETIEPMTLRLFREMPDSEDPEDTSDPAKLLKFVGNAVTEGLVSSLRSSSSLPGTLFLLRTWLKVQPRQLQNDAIANGLLKVLQNLSKVHMAHSGGPDPSYRLIMAVLDVVRDRPEDLREHRKTLTALVSLLIERTQNLALCKYLLDMVKQWVLDDPEPTSLPKEKSMMLLRMAVFEHREEALFEGYLDLIYDIYDREDMRGSDLTHKLESAFLHGTKSKTRRTKFLDKLEQSLPRTLDGRLQYLFSLQNWDTLADSNWIPQLLSMLMALVEPARLIRNPLGYVQDADPLLQLAAEATSTNVSEPARQLILHDEELAHRLFTVYFPMCWASLTRSQQTSFTPYIIKLLSKDYMKKQVDLKSNVIQTMLEGIHHCTPAVTLPPLLVKYLAKTYNAWYVGLEILGRLSEVYATDEELKNSCTSALSELYAELGEDDYFYGISRTRCVYPETTAALSYEQNGNWPKALEMYEQAQMRARNGLLPFSEVEYCFWEDHWILAAQKLQNWEALTELARIDQDADLLLECAWRLSDWGSSDRETIESNIHRVLDTPTPRRKTFEAYTFLLKAQNTREPPNEFLRILDEAQQVSLRRWVSLPSRHLTAAHVPLLQMFQQCVELTEASMVFDSLQLTNQANLETRANSDLKQVFAIWKERLPNFWDDISVWSDLLAWRQHVFQAVTKVYVPLIPAGEQGTYGYRGYHETAWTINRFGEVARRHNLHEVCSTSLNKIYSLPNIEITEAFLKLKEQALCFFDRPDKFNEGLENISTTNLMYFSPAQKAEFLTLKGMFISKLGQQEGANAEFAHAIQMDMTLPKAWAEWARFNDRIYRERPEFPTEPPPEPEAGQPPISVEEWNARHAKDRAVFASSAVSCYLQAAGLSANHKSRAYLLRVLWLLSLDDNQNTISKAFDNYKGDTVIWYWITLIPQLLMSLSHREAKQARTLLMQLARNYPQALFFHMRVAREEFSLVKRQHLAAQQKIKDEEARRAAAAAAAAAAATGNGEGANDPAEGAVEARPPGPEPPRQPWELCEELVNLLKTSFPLLSLTMEKMVDQIAIRAKPASDEDIYRFFAALLGDSMSQQINRGVNTDDVEVLAGTRDNMAKFSNNLPADLKAGVEHDFIRNPPPLRVYVQRLMLWRDSYERGLDSRPRIQPLDQGGCNLIDFHLTKFDDVEIPGQYVHHIDPNTELVKIARFNPKHEAARGHAHCYKRITLIGSDGERHVFSIQLPAARHCRREERLTQAYRILNSVLMRRKESRRRNLQFHLPAALTLAPQLRITRTDSSYISLQDIYDQHAQRNGRSRESASVEFHNRVAELYDPAMTNSDARYLQLRAEVFEEIQAKMDPETILTNYMVKTMSTPESLWLMRKQFAVQMSTLSFLTYFSCLTNRAPPRFHLSRTTGLMYMSEILLGFAAGHPIISAASESVPFRLTPNIQHFIGRTGIEGIMVGSITAIARSLSPPEFELEGSLHLFVRDELLTWQASWQRPVTTNGSLAVSVYNNVDSFVRRTKTMGYMNENIKNAGDGPPTVHAVVSLISEATSPLRLAQMTEPFLAWF